MHLEGKTTCIRTLVKHDLPLLVKWKNDPVIEEMVSGNSLMTSLELEEKRFERSLEDYNTLRLIIEKSDSSPIGFVSISNIDKYNKKVELGMLIGEKKEWGKGYGTDALRTIINYIFNKLGFNRIGVEVFCYNQRAINLYNKIGFVTEGTQRQGLCRNGAYIDILFMGLIKQDYIMNRKQKSTAS